jgi:hypothetical protein
VAAQNQPQFRALAAQGPFCLVGGQPIGMLLAGDNGLDHGSPAGAEDIGGNRVELDTGILQNLVNPVMRAVALFGQLDPVMHQIAQLTRSLGRHKTGLDQTVRWQLAEPLTVADAVFLPGPVLA